MELRLDAPPLLHAADQWDLSLASLIQPPGTPRTTDSHLLWPDDPLRSGACWIPSCWNGSPRGARADELEEQLANQLAEVRAERDELAVAERGFERMTGQLAEERSSARPMPGQVGGRTVMLIPHREPGVEEDALPWDYQRIIAAVRQDARPVMAREVGEVMGVDTSVKAKLEPLRSKLVRLVDRGWLRKLSDGRSTTRL
ncbi:hypothetical protein ACIPJK_37240 [Streptomyces roseus]|uniref:hypothetical protein n=1 Tax=Streptomyces roseus TaxID=66430 RepID=UPI0038250675